MLNRILPKKYYPFRLFILLWLFAAVLASMTDFARLSGAGDFTRMGTAVAIVERGTLTLDGSIFMSSVDKVYINENFYGCQIPFMSILLSAVYYPLYSIGITCSNNYDFLNWLFIWLFSGSGAAGCAVILGNIFRRERNDDAGAYKFALLFFFFTLYLTFSIVFSHHVFTGFLILASFYLIRYYSGKLYLIGLAGLMSGMAVVIDPPPGAAFTGVFFLYLVISRKSISRIAVFTLMCLPPLIIHGLGNVQITGSIIPSNIKPEYFQYYGSIFDETNLSGVVINDTIKDFATYTFHSFFGYRGLFIYTPLLIFAVWGAIIGLKDREKRIQIILISFAIISVLFFYLWRTNNYGGYCYGIRFFLPLVPILFSMMIYFWDKLKKRSIRRIFKVAAVISLIFALVGIYRPYSDSRFGYNSFAANLYFFQSLKLPQFNKYTWKIMVAINGYDPEIIAFVSSKMLQAGTLDSAEEGYRRSLKEGYTTDGAIGLAEVLYQKGDVETALKDFKTIYYTDDEPQLSLKIAQILNETGEYDSSNSYLDRYISYGDSIALHIEPALLDQGLGFYGKRGRDLALSLMAENYISMDSLSLAEQTIREFSTGAYNIVEPHIITARVNILKGDTSLAQMHVKKAMAIQPDIYKILQDDKHLSSIINQVHEDSRKSRR